jgi:hypothetical protein
LFPRYDADFRITQKKYEVLVEKFYVVHRLAYNDDVVAFKMDRRQGARSGASRTSFTVAEPSQIARRVKLVPDATDEQRSRRPIFNATGAAASWLFFLRRGGSTRMNPDMGASLAP